MGKNRLFVSQSTLDSWLGEARVQVDGDVMMLLPEKHRFTLETAVLFKSEVTGAGDPHSLLGRVKDIEQIAALGGDYSSGSVIIGDLAYEVVEGLAGMPIDPKESQPNPDDDLTEATRRAAGTERPAELDTLAKLFLERRS
jgi:hypothetical protein